MLSQVAYKLKQAGHANSTGRYERKHRGSWRRWRKREFSRRKALQRAAEEEEQCCTRKKCSSTREGSPGMRASVGARDARRDVEKVQRNGGGGGIQRELTALRVYWGALEGGE